MIRLTFDYVFKDELISTLAGSIGLLLVGFVAGLFYFKSAPRLNRAPYFALFAMVEFCMFWVYLPWSALPELTKAGWWWAIALGDWLTYFTAGFLFGYLSIGRSIDAFGSKSRAWLGIVPLANLWLLFAPSQDEANAYGPSALREGKGVALGLVLGGLGRMLDANYEDELTAIYTKMWEDPAFVMAFRSAEISAIGLEERLSQLAQAEGENYEINEWTYFGGASAAGTVVTYDYMFLDTAGGSLNASFIHDVVQDICSAFPAELAAGATVVDNYHGNDSALIGTVTVRAGDCQV